MSSFHSPLESAPGSCQRPCVLLDHRDCDRVVVLAVESLCVVWVFVLCVGSSGAALVVGCGCVGKLVGTSPCVGLDFPVRPLWLSHWLVVGWSVLCWMGWLGRVVVMLIETGRVVVV